MKSWSLNRKIWSIVGVLTFAFVACTVASYFGLRTVQGEMAQVTGTFVPRYGAALTFRDDQRALNGALFEFLSSDSEKKRQAQLKKFDEKLEAFRKHLAAYQEIASPEGRALAEKYSVGFEKYLAAAREAMELAEQKQAARAEARMDEVAAVRGEMLQTVDQISELTLTRVNAASAQASTAISRTIWFNVASAAFAIVAALLLAGSVLGALRRTIDRIVQHLAQSSEQVNAAATQIASASEQLSQSSTEQAASLEETAASVEEMNSMVAKNAQNANSASTTSNSSRDMVGQGQRVVEKMTNSMTAINRNSDALSDVVKVIEQIDKKTKVINDIVNKTELLSFNASVEAARAGEHGKGFAVVAEEVGNLARVSGAAAEEITNLLATSLTTVHELVREIKQSVSSGTEVAGECGELFQRIVVGVNGVAETATEIASASAEQARGVTEITKAMNQLDQTTQQNASTAEECAAAAEQLSGQATALDQTVRELMTTVYGASTDAPAAPPATRASSARATGSVTHLKAVRPAAGPAVRVPVQKASGAPGYDSQGFTDV